jgi:hypothetical protein
VRILAIKGGGVRGLLAARLGERLARKDPGWSDRANLIAGTSTGGILALALAAGRTWREAAALYEEQAQAIFAGQGRGAAQYSNDGLRRVLEQTFGGMRLRELRQDVLVPAFDLDGQLPDGRRTWQAKFFDREHDGDERVLDVAMATSAAPTYFQPWQGYVDGGLVANDPSVAALAHALKRLVPDAAAALMAGSVSLFTLGTGKVPHDEPDVEDGWGLEHLGRALVKVVTDGGAMWPLYQAVALLGGRHHELDPELPCEVELDGGADLEEAIEVLLDVARETKLGPTRRWLRTHGWTRA